MNTNTNTTQCPKCFGEGRITMYGHVAGGVCFTCKGSGVVTAASQSAKARREAKAHQAHLDRYQGLVLQHAALTIAQYASDVHYSRWDSTVPAGIRAEVERGYAITQAKAARIRAGEIVTPQDTCGL
jgi:hypothetical protein